MSVKSPAVRSFVFFLSVASLLALVMAGPAASRPQSDASSTTPTGGYCFKRHAGKRCSMVVGRASTRRSADSTPPSVSWKAPTAGQSVAGSITGSTCEVAASDNRGVKKVVFKVDGTTLNSEAYAPWSCQFRLDERRRRFSSPDRHRLRRGRQLTRGLATDHG